MPESVTPILGEVQLRSAQRITTHEQRALVELRIPGMAGSAFQDMGRDATRIALQGLLFGDDALQALERLRQAFQSGEPLPFAADITTATEIIDVLIEDLQVVEAAGRPQTFAYRLVMRESPPPPPPSNPFAAVDAGILGEAQNLFDEALSLSDVISTLESVPGFGDPTPPLSRLLDGLGSAIGDLSDQLSPLSELFAEPEE